MEKILEKKNEKILQNREGETSKANYPDYLEGLSKLIYEYKLELKYEEHVYLPLKSDNAR